MKKTNKNNVKLAISKTTIKKLKNGDIDFLRAGTHGASVVTEDACENAF